MDIDKLILKVISEKLKIQNSENIIELEKRGLILPPIKDSPWSHRNQSSVILVEELTNSPVDKTEIVEVIVQ